MTLGVSLVPLVGMMLGNSLEPFPDAARDQLGEELGDILGKSLGRLPDPP